MNALYSLEDRILGRLGRLLGGDFLTTLARLVFFATLATFFWASATTKLGLGFEGIFSPSVGAYAQIFPAQMEAVGYDPSQLGIIVWLVVLAGMWAEFLIPALIVVGLFTRAASLAMVGFIVVMSIGRHRGPRCRCNDDRCLVRPCSRCQDTRSASDLDSAAACPPDTRRRSDLDRRHLRARTVIERYSGCFRRVR